MADRRAPLDPHPVVSGVVEGAPDGAVCLRGYLGPPTREGHVSLYPDLGDLSHCVVIPASDIVHHTDAPAEVLPHGGTCLWVRRDARLVHEQRTTPAVTQHVFSGKIADGHGSPKLLRKLADCYDQSEDVTSFDYACITGCECWTGGNCGDG